MTRPSLRILFSFFSFLFCVFVVTAFYCAPALGQTYCGPNTVVNFNSSDGAYP